MVALAEKFDSQMLDAICRKRRVRKLRIFGSFMRGEERSDSDVDLLIEFDADARPTLLDMAAIRDELSPVFGGRRIDVARPGQLHWYLRNRILEEAQEVYAR